VTTYHKLIRVFRDRLTVLCLASDTKDREVMRNMFDLVLDMYTGLLKAYLDEVEREVIPESTEMRSGKWS
jgi:phosphate uptake regulator